MHSVVDTMDAGAVPGAFCKLTEDFLSGDPGKCNVIHADGSGTKSIIAYLAYKEFGDPSVFAGIAQDSIVMNLDDLLCVGAGGRILLSNTINRNALNCPGRSRLRPDRRHRTVPREAFARTASIFCSGGETADVGDLTGTIVVDSCAVSIMKKQDVIRNRITPDLVDHRPCPPPDARTTSKPINSGIGSNGLTSARHDMLSQYYADRCPETFDPNVASDLVYCGPYKLEDPLPDSDMSVGEAILSPTRTYAPAIYRMIDELGEEIRGLVHCSGGAQTKCLRFGARRALHQEQPVPDPAGVQGDSRRPRTPAGRRCTRCSTWAIEWRSTSLTSGLARLSILRAASASTPGASVYEAGRARSPVDHGS
ncbi:MAG: phosphoribosylformylglycinamidine cyclo-ligase [Gammaproteobacteria bacterium]|nr:phosphoribosylformylglycinamidine cyclo-ligase [Gammaproteobacteria bacterium]